MLGSATLSCVSNCIRSQAGPSDQEAHWHKEWLSVILGAEVAPLPRLHPQLLQYPWYPPRHCGGRVDLSGPPCEGSSYVQLSQQRGRNSLAVQWLGLSAFPAVAQVRSLVRELRSHKPCRAQPKKEKKKLAKGLPGPSKALQPAASSPSPTHQCLAQTSTQGKAFLFLSKYAVPTTVTCSSQLLQYTQDSSHLQPGHLLFFFFTWKVNISHHLIPLHIITIK